MSSSRFNAPHPFRDAGVVADCLTGIRSATVKCLFVLNRSCIHTRFYGVPTSKNPEDSNSLSGVLLYLSVMTGITDNTSHSTKMCHSIIKNVQNPLNYIIYNIFYIYILCIIYNIPRKGERVG
jgi:hypothetical protein